MGDVYFTLACCVLLYLRGQARVKPPPCADSTRTVSAEIVHKSQNRGGMSNARSSLARRSKYGLLLLTDTVQRCSISDSATLRTVLLLPALCQKYTCHCLAELLLGAGPPSCC